MVEYLAPNSESINEAIEIINKRGLHRIGFADDTIVSAGGSKLDHMTRKTQKVKWMGYKQRTKI